MFFGEALAFLIYIIMKRRDPETFNIRMLDANSQGKQVKFNKFLLAIPAISDLITSTLQYIALNFVAGSVYQMMRGGAIVTTFVFSIIFLNMKAQKNQIAGSALALVGVLIVGASSLIFSASDSSGTDTVYLELYEGTANNWIYFIDLIAVYKRISICV
jgi:drug/metabolite transporter (DMT)-like permease